MASSTGSRKLLVIGFDAADWKMIHPLVDAGLMPTLSKFIDEGCIGNLATLHPSLSPMLWTSIATGKTADKHGVCGFVEPLADASGVRLVGSATRTTKAFWNITSQAGLKTHVIGWYASHPAEPINGVCVSDQFIDAAAIETLGAISNPDAHPLAREGSIHPESLRERLSGYRVGRREIGAGDLLPFIPKLSEVNPADPRPARLASALAACASIHAVATDVLATEPWDVAAVYYDAIDRVGHDFMPFHPPKLANVTDRDFDLYQNVMSGIYRFHDMLLDTLLQLAGPETTVVLLSDHGFHSDHLRPAVPASTMEADAAQWHRQFGIIALRGPGVKQDDRVYGATLLDVAPTLLAILDLPVGDDMDGQVIAQAFERPPTTTRVGSWDTVGGASGRHAPRPRPDATAAIDAAATAAALQQLVELGYLAPQADSAASTVDQAAREWQFNLATVHVQMRRHEQAEAILAPLVAAHADEVRYVGLLAHSLIELRRHEEAQKLLSAAELKAPENIDVQLMLGQCELSLGLADQALARLERLEAREVTSVGLYCLLGDTYRTRALYGKAEAAFRRAIAIDAESERAQYGLSLVYLLTQRWEAAAEHALAAIGLLYGYASAHYVLGVALDELQQTDRAITSLKVATQLAPNFPEATERLAAILLREGRVEEAMRYRARPGGPL